MKLVVTTESRFFRNRDGRPVCLDGTYGYSFWQRYLDVFDEVTILGRDAAQTSDDGVPVEGPGVTLLPLPDSRGLFASVRRMPQWRRAIGQILDEDTAVVLRLPGLIGVLLSRCLPPSRHAWGIELIGDPESGLFAGQRLTAWRRTVRWQAARLTRQLCHTAHSVAYVTESHLQAHYPYGPHTWATHYSSIELDASWYSSQHRRDHADRSHWRLIHVGTMSQPYKGQHLLLEAVRINLQRGADLHLTLVGDGRERPNLVRRAEDLGIAARVEFSGSLPRGPVLRAALDEADLFVLPSLTEGLPRVLIEAQARGLPCIATRVGGTPELLPATQLVPPGDAASLAQAIHDLITSPARMTECSRQNLERAQAYRDDLLRARRREHYQVLRGIQRTLQLRHPSRAEAQTCPAPRVSDEHARLPGPAFRARVDRVGT